MGRPEFLVAGLLLGGSRYEIGKGFPIWKSAAVAALKHKVIKTPIAHGTSRRGERFLRSGVQHGSEV